METFSGNFPLEFISFSLDMSSEERNKADPATTTETLMEEEVPQVHEEAEISHATATLEDAESKQPEQPDDNPTKVGPTPSPSTDESISAYIERQLQVLGCQGTARDITFLHPTTSAVNRDILELTTKKVSESEPILQVVSESTGKVLPEVELDRLTDINRKAGFSVAKVDYFQTDTSDVEELLDSSGAETTKESPSLIPIESSSTTGSEANKKTEHPTSVGLPDISTTKPLSPARPLSASARTLINQFFSETNPSILPVGHATGAFNQGQVHSILRAVSNETLTSSLHQMKNILEEAIRVGVRYQGGQQWSGRQRVKFFRKQSDRPGKDGQDSDTGTEGYTSGALSSEDDFVINSQRAAREIDIAPTPSPFSQSTTSTAEPSTSYQVPSPGFCATDYEPFATLTGDQVPVSSVLHANADDFLDVMVKS